MHAREKRSSLFCPAQIGEKKFYNISNSQAIMKLPFDKPRLENVTIPMTQCDKNAM